MDGWRSPWAPAVAAGRPELRGGAMAAALELAGVSHSHDSVYQKPSRGHGKEEQPANSPSVFEVPVRQDDAGLHFMVDDVTALLTSCELHIPEGNGTVKVATGVVSPIDSTKTPRIHTVIIPPGTSPNLSPCIHSPHDHSAVGHDDVDDFIQDKAASPPPAVSPLQRTPTPLAAKSPPPQQAPTASPPPPPMPTPAASSALIGPSRNKSPTGPQRSVQPMPKKQAVVTKIPKMTKLSYEKTDKELEASVKSDIHDERTQIETR
ncbi:sulfated surface glycoprotein 185-like [Sorghum bicolor]|uniref:sulfated surface glycoprotein 185-like n=1 Tax=Sorghum bicolor TaxID=4558 RepID=UPI000B4243CC|nr:sulfated surface glycoprotein 185-like [Sorghum bicolor]|eukprot:XP_021305482.1 sulfated surface glycoprotein 185-like [Sorghum bicolor]